MMDASVPKTADAVDAHAVSADLLAWYDTHRRVLAWRAPPGRAADPYHVWLSEIMLQQTTAAAVDGYFRRFVDRWPDLSALAGAALDDILTAWSGLGYYARARNLHACARLLCERFGGRFPDDEESLRRLPGVGRYTAAAIAAIAFDRRAVVVDGNVERVVARLFLVSEPLPQCKADLYALAGLLTPSRRSGDHAQAMMDLGATICTPRRPKCLLCPLARHCQAHLSNRAEALPRKPAKAERPTRRGVAFWVVDRHGAVLLRRRPRHGLLGGMTEVPSTPWREGPMPPLADALVDAPVRTRWRLLPGSVRHVFTHFHLELTVAAGRVDLHPRGLNGFWAGLGELGDQALPSVMRKVVGHAIRHAIT